MKHRSLLFIITLLFASFTLFSQEQKKSDAGGPPPKSELIGFWKMMELPNKEKMNEVNPWPQPYQWFAFFENGKIYSMMTTTDGNYTQKQLKQIFEVLPKERTPNYVYDGTFLIIDNPEIKDYQEVWGMNLFAKDIGTKIKKGDLIMSLDDGTGHPIYYRLLRKVE